MNVQKTQLTQPQQKLLREIADRPGRTGWDAYPPLIKLQELGFVRIRQGNFSCASFVTDLGREWLELHK